MAFIFNMRTTSKSPGSMHRRDLSTANSLPGISEDSASFINPRASPRSSPRTPPVPLRASNRPSEKHFALGIPPRFNYEGSPPAYGSDESPTSGPLDGESGEKLAELRRGVVNNRHIAKRGGWKRLLIVGAIAAVLIVALVVGLVVGLRNRDNNSNGNDESSSVAGGASGSTNGPSDPNLNAPFPAGSYTFTTYLSSVSTNCSSNPSTWVCFPYSTYSQNPAASSAKFDWVISLKGGTRNNFTISSTPNVFSVLFTNASLSLRSAGTADEHFFFRTSMQKPTRPAGALSSTNVAASCYFNQTIFQGSLYTRRPKTYPSTVNAPDAREWPYAVKVEQTATSGSGTPTCLDPSGNSLGDFSVQESNQLCECLYLNTGT